MIEMKNSKFDDLIRLINGGEIDAIKFYNRGNMTAGVRLRKRMQAIKELAQAVREEVREVRGK